MITRAFLAAFLLAWLVPAAPATDVPERDAAAIRAVIERQLDAFRRDDARLAFSLATESIRLQFGTAENFMQMVRSAYPAVYRPSSVRFEKPDTVDGEVFQPVRLSDEHGQAWIALYPMRRNREGRWLINGCQLYRAPGQAT